MLRGRRIIWVTLVAPRIVNDASQVKRINREIHFCVAGAGFGEGGVWLSWQAQHYVVFFCHTKCVSKMGRVRSPKRRVRGDNFLFGLSWDYPRIVFMSLSWRKQFEGFLAQTLTSQFRGRCSTWWVWRVTLLAPRIENDVSCVMRINHEINFAWQAQYLVSLKGDFSCSPHCKCPFICDADQSWDSFCVKLEDGSCCPAHCKWRG